MSDREILKREKRKRITGHTEDTHQANDAVWHWNVIKVQRSIVAVSTGILEAQVIAVQITVKLKNKIKLMQQRHQLTAMASRNSNK